jgi:outer membrane immunogenic protein
MKLINAAALLAASCWGGQALAQPSAARVELLTGYDLLVSPDIYEGDDDVIPDKLPGLRLGATVGYDMAVTTRLTIGLEAGIGTTVADGVSSRFQRQLIELDAGLDWDLSVRGAFRVRPTTNLFLKAGYARSSSSARYSERVADTTEVTEYEGKASGIRLGAGLEQELRSGFYVKGEYRWTRYDDGIEYQSRTDRHQLLVGIGKRF